MQFLSIRSRPFAIGVLLFSFTASTAVAQTRAVLFKGASIVDGSGRPAFTGDVRVRNGKIEKLGLIKPANGDEVINAAGKILSPGFIDIHNHSETGLLREGTAANQVSQGITTIIVGPDGDSPFPIGEYLAKLNGRIAPNVGTFVGHATVRELVLKNDHKRAATADEIERMKLLVEQGMRDGAFGLSSGLEYDVGFSATTDEIIELSRVASKHHGIYMSHIRDEEEGFLAAMQEAIRIGRAAGLPVQISHIKMGNRNVWGKSFDAISLLEEAKRSGLDITADAYPYTAWASTITVLVPSRKHDDRQEVERGLNNVGGADKVLITSCAKHPDFEGKTLDEIARQQGTSPIDVYIQIVKDGGAGVVCNSMSEDDVKAFYLRPWVMVSSDGGIGSRHPRGSGTFTRVLGKFVRENRWLPVEEAVRKMSAMPAARLGLKDRGMIKSGYKADLVLFDMDRVTDRATFTDPQRVSEGVEMVFVNGIRVWESGKITNNLPGDILKRR